MQENKNEEKNENKQNENGFVFAIHSLEELEFFFAVRHKVVIVADATYNVIRKSGLKLFSVCFFDEHHNRRHLLTILLGSESEKSISEGLTSLLSWAQRNGKTFPRVKCVLTDLASSFINAFTKTFISILGTNGVD